MNRFTADYSSSISSTPGKDAPSRGVLPSNAPQLASTTPIAPPPSQIFGSSGYGTGVSKLQLTKPTKGSPPQDSLKAPLPPRTKNGTPNFTRVRRNYSQEEESDMMEEDDDEQEDRYAPLRGFQSVNPQPAQSLMKFSTASTRDSRFSTTSTRDSRFSTTSTRDSRLAAPRKSFRTSTRISALPHKGNDTVAQNLAKDMGARAQKASLTEPDEVILETEQILRSLDEQSQYLKDSTRALDIIAEYAYDLVKQWQRFVESDQPSLDSNDIGPQPSAPAFAKANYLASLLLVLRHPPPGSDDTPTPTPQVLLDWLEQYHVSYDGMYNAVASNRPNCTAHDLFWDAVLSLTLRGKLQQVMQLFADADFRYAASATDDGTHGNGYKGAQLQTIQSVIYRARQLLNSCPAIQLGDWNVAGPDWDVFRTAVEAALDNLTEEATAHKEEEAFEAENFGLRRPENRLLGKLGQKSSSTLPWTIFQNLKILYNILLGSAEEISAQSQDWLEAATSLTIWWDGTADSAAVAQWSFDVSRANNPAAQNDDTNPYLVRLRDSFLCVTSPDDSNSFQINGMSPVEVGLGCILQGSSQGALTVLRTLSQCIASSVAEIGSTAGWLEDDSTVHPAGLNEEDLLVLSYGAPRRGISKDDLLLSYAELLFERNDFHLTDGSSVEGWEVSISLVTRLDDREAMRTAVSTFLDQLDVSKQDRAEKLTNLCSDLGLQDEARKVSGRFGDHLINNTDDFGTALLCYARAHQPIKIRNVIDGLVSYSLIQSRAYPAESELDAGLRSLVGNPKTALAGIAEVDPQAAEMLQFNLVGYACIRRFYTLRDQDQNNVAGQKNLRPLARKRAAAKALVASINSAADSIYGGLYDPERRSAIQVDGLLILFGEVTALLSTKSSSTSASNATKESTERTRIFTLPHLYALLSAVEDLSTVSDRVFRAAAECLSFSIAEFNGVKPASPRAVLKKSLSNASAGSGGSSGFTYSVLGSEMLGMSMASEGSASGGSSAVMVRGRGGKESAKGKGKDGSGAARGWDWRERLVQASESGDGEVSGQDVLRILRIQLAEELAWAELEEGGAGGAAY